MNEQRYQVGQKLTLKADNWNNEESVTVVSVTYDNSIFDIVGGYKYTIQSEHGNTFTRTENELSKMVTQI